MNFSLPEIRAFVAVVRCRTFTAASSQLNITQPALTRRIQLIEHALGAPLFERLPGGPKLTDTGREFLPHAEMALMALEDGLDAARGTVRGDKGRVSLATIGALCNDVVVHALRQFKSDHPGADLSLSFHADTSDDVSEMVLQGDAIWGLRFRTDPRLHSETIGHESMLVVCSTRHKLANVQNVSPASLYDETWITFPLGPGHDGNDFWARLSIYGFQGQRVMLTDSTAAQKRLIEADFGIGVMPKGSVKNELRAGLLQVIDVASAQPSIPIVLVRRKEAYVSKISQLLAKRLASAYAEDHPAPEPVKIDPPVAKAESQPPKKSAVRQKRVNGSHRS